MIFSRKFREDTNFLFPNTVFSFVQKIKLPSIILSIGLLLLFMVQSGVEAQQLHQVYMINHNTAAHYHAFSRIDRASLIEAIEKMGLAAFPCGVDLLSTQFDINTIVFNFQLYRACPLIELKPHEDPTPLLSNKAKEAIQQNKTRLNFKELAEGLQDASIFDETAEVTFMTEDDQLKKFANLNEPYTQQVTKDLASLHLNFTNHKHGQGRGRRSTVNLLDIKNINITAVSTGTKMFVMGLNSEDYEEPDRDYYSDMTAEDTQIEAAVLMDALKSSKFAHEGCISQRLEPIEATRGLRPFGGDGYILNEVLREILNMAKSKPSDHYLININYRPVKCYTLCTTLLPLTPSTSVCGGIQVHDFENKSTNELWSFVNSEQLDDALAASKHSHMTSSRYVPPPYRSVSKEDNFRPVVGSVKNSSNHYAYFLSREPKQLVPMIVSTYFQHTATTCELVLRHQVHGLQGAELIVSTQHLQHHALLGAENENEDEEDADDWVRPTLRASFKPVRDDNDQWTTSRVSIGQTLYPTRIRIECHTAQQQRDPSLLNVECNIDDIDLVNCDEEIWKANVCTSTKQSKKYLCHRKGPQKCIDYSDVCDFHSECDDNEDEEDTLHKCSMVPPGARCDFESSVNQVGCPHWKFFLPSTSSSNNGSQYLQRVSLADTKRLPTHGLPPNEFSYHGSKRIAGHFLFFSTYSLSSDHQPNGEVLYTYAVTPAFPPTSLATSLSDSPSYRTCMVRFFYCHTGTSTFQLMLENGADFSHKEVLWTPPKATGSEPCSWQKASASVPHQETEYRFKIAFGKLYKQPVSVAIDDFTMTPNCFLELNSWSSRFVPDKLRVESCSPEQKNCKEPQLDSKTSTTIANDKRSWLVPLTGLYHIQLFGASGGQLPSQKAGNFGGVIAANLKLQRNQELSFVVGQSGMNPCTSDRRVLVANQGKSNSERLWRIICANGSVSSSDLDFARRDVQNLFGSSGGGATAFYLDNVLAGIAGAGGGLFPETFMLSSDSKYDPTGGQLFDSTNKSNTKPLFANWAAGNGASFGPHPQQSTNNLPSSCADCGQMAGYSLNVKERQQFLGGYCPQGRHYNVTGGFGGGGSSCGPGAGGGAGFQGGNAGHKSHAEGGTSAFLIKNAQFEWSKGVNRGNGQILIVRCALKCPTNSTCAFEKPVPGIEAEQFCQCMNGKQTTSNGSCSLSGISSLIYQVGATIGDALNVEPSVGIFIFILLVLLLFIIPIISCYMYMRLRYDCASPFMRRIKFWLFPNKRNEEFEMNSRVGSSSVMERSRSTIGGNLIKENPIYERLVMMELPHISRHFIHLNRSIGHGAFGEVFEGFFHLNDSVTRVAVKTLPIDSNPESDVDFETEARLLNQFDHPNIVQFYGVSFEQQPKYIILEFLEGGDMRNFLRECRPKPTVPLDDPQPIAMIDLIHMALDVAHGCAYLENSKFVHRDIAARNCLLTTKGPGRVVKIADFGMSKDLFSTDYYRKGGRAFLAVKWLPPEGFLDGIFNSKTDVWSYGILLWEIFSMGYMPYTLRQNQEVMQLVVAGGRLEPPVGVPDEIYDQMLCCWNTEPDARPNFNQIVDFFTNLATDPRIINLPVPPILYRQSQMTPTSTPSTTRSSIPPPNDDIVTSQTTMSTAMASSMTESTTNSSVSMPTQGEGVSHNVFPPYQSRFSRPLMEMRPHHQLIRDSSLSSHDDSTLHDTCSVKQSPYRIDKDALKAMQLQAANPHIMTPPEIVPFIPLGAANPTPPPKHKRFSRSMGTPSPEDESVPQSPAKDKHEEQTSPLV